MYECFLHVFTHVELRVRFCVWISVTNYCCLKVKRQRLERREKEGPLVFWGDLHPLLSLSNSLILHSELLFRPMNVI